MCIRDRYITDGIPAIRSVAGFKNLYTVLLQNLAIYTAVNIPIGTPITIAPAVIYILPSMYGKIPYKSFPGLHTLPSRNFTGPISAIAGIPFAKRKMCIRDSHYINTDNRICICSYNNRR